MFNFCILPTEFSVNICGVNIVKSGISNKLIEFNNDLELLDSKNSFWKSKEEEIKITLSKDVRNIIEDLQNSSFDRFIFSELSMDTTFEIYYTVFGDRFKHNCVKLGKRSWKRKVALKSKRFIKSSKSILSKKMKIQEWQFGKSEQENIASMLDNPNSILSYKKHHAFYKHKARVVCVDKINGSVFGVSADISCPLKRNQFLSQIEIEYWSQLIVENEKLNLKIISSNERYSFKMLHNLILNILKHDKLTLSNYNPTKYEWIKNIE